MAKIAVVRGGRSLEREISLRSGHHVASALRHLGHEPHELDVDERLTSGLEAMDAVFVALHGRDGEDGTLQGVCEALGLPYTGSGPLACHLSFDKGILKGVLDRAGIATPAGHVVSAEAVRRLGAGSAVRRGAERLGLPIVVKPVTQGSALGLSVVEEPDDLSAGVMAAFNYADRVLLERFVDGVELAVSVWGPDLEPLPPVEIRTASGVFDFSARVNPGGADFLCPAELDADTLAAVNAAAREACRTLQMRDFARVDMVVDASGPKVLEVNPCPGLTESSLLPLAVATAGHTFEDFIRVVTDAALARA